VSAMHEEDDEFEPAPAADETDAERPDARPVRAEVPSTGHPAVDAVLASLAGLEDAPVHEHVAVFESAHESLRRALDEAGQEPGPSDDQQRQG
jgi:hypothetical protein